MACWTIENVDAFHERERLPIILFGETTGTIGDVQMFITDPEPHIWEFQGPSSAAD